MGISKKQYFLIIEHSYNCRLICPQHLTRVLVSAMARKILKDERFHVMVLVSHIIHTMTILFQTYRQGLLRNITLK